MSKPNDTQLLNIQNFYIAELGRISTLSPATQLATTFALVANIYTMGFKEGYRMRDGEKIIGNIEENGERK